MALGVLALLTLGEIRLFDRLLFSEGVRSDTDFVLLSVQGVLEGRPVSKSWQHRLLGPTVVASLVPVAGDRRQALRLFEGAMVAAANLLLFGLLRRKGARPASALLGVALFGLAHALAMYRFEYPWDSVDILIFLAFGYWVSQRGSLLRFSPLLLVGTLNHETILYIPFWYLLAPLEPGSATATSKRDIPLAVVLSLAMGGCMLLLRARLYVGRPDLPGQEFEEALPLVGNHFHLVHNAGQLLSDFINGRAFISAAFLSAVALLFWRARRGIDVRAAVWSFVVLATIVCFGYVNETRHYLCLLAFWFAYRWPVAPL
jgi:hypothetical protein